MPRLVCRHCRIHDYNSGYFDVFTASVADRGEKLELLIDKTEDLSSNVSYYKIHQLPELEWGNFQEIFSQSFIYYVFVN